MCFYVGDNINEYVLYNGTLRITVVGAFGFEDLDF